MHDAPKDATKLPEGLLPPELVIQDELHLISGPLGTMVGLYEAAIDYLCERTIDGVARVPKVVWSTATVRRAKEQIRALFGREMVLFPPRGIDEGELREAWDLGRLCSNDPVCAAHDPAHPSSDRRSEGAACHGCLYIAECSCEWQNRFLDRALLVPTIGNDPELAFFRERP
jgi:hypothetical protein